MSNAFVSLGTLGPKEVYAQLVKETEQKSSEELLSLCEHLGSLLDTEQSRKHVVYSIVEVLRLLAPKNPFEEAAIDSVFRYLAAKGPKDPEGKRALETVGSYRMVALLENTKLVNALAESALAHLSKTWASEVLQSILEEKEEDLGREVKSKIVKGAAGGNISLEGFVQAHPLLFLPSISELVCATERKKIALIKKFNSISKDVITPKLVEESIEDLQEKKDFLRFVEESTVRRELLGVVKSLSEDRSVWIRCQVPATLLKKSKDPFYTAAVGAEIRKSALEVWRRRMHDTSSAVRAGVLRNVQHADLQGCPEAKELVLERVRDTEAGVREEALRLCSEEYKAYFAVCRKRKALGACAETGRAFCAVCMQQERSPTCLVSVLQSLFIDDHAAQVSLVKKFFAGLHALDRLDRLEEEDVLDNLDNRSDRLDRLDRGDVLDGSETLRVFDTVLLGEIYRAVEENPCDFEILMSCMVSLSLLEVSCAMPSDVCLKHKDTLTALVQVLSLPHEDTLVERMGHETPPSLLVMVAEMCFKGGVPASYLSLLKDVLGRVPERLFYRISRMVTIAEHNGDAAWKDMPSSALTDAYRETKQIATMDGAEASLDISKIAEHTHTSAESFLSASSVNVQAQEALLCSKPFGMRFAVLLDLLECCVRSALLERVSLAELTSSTYAEYAEIDSSVFFRQRLTAGVRSHPDLEIRLLFSVIYTLVSKAPHLQLEEKSLKDLLVMLCWVLLEYRSARGPEVIAALLRGNRAHAQEFFSVFVNLKRLSVHNEEKRTEMYVLSEEVCAVLEKICAKAGINTAQYTNELPPMLVESLRARGGWTATLTLLEDNQFSSNLLTVFKQ
ncbi:hypothetical protein NECID01_1894 [Nematocida sp. AWRm77]|nr:hypothetical protein NECID01_1894 [Nematocida sp. AWRm77]